MTKDKIRNTLKKEAEKAGLVNILNIWGVVCIIVIIVIGGYKVWVNSSKVPELEAGQIRIEQKVNDIGIYLTQNPRCEVYSKEEITKDNWQKHIKEE